jgi:hypothetical protein
VQYNINSPSLSVRRLHSLWAHNACRKAVEEGGSSYTATQKLERDMLASYVPGKQ